MSSEKWQPIETAPEGVTFLATGFDYGDPKEARHYVIAIKRDGVFLEQTEGDDPDFRVDRLDNLTHWMPLPSPPEAPNEQ